MSNEKILGLHCTEVLGEYVKDFIKRHPERAESFINDVAKSIEGIGKILESTEEGIPRARLLIDLFDPEIESQIKDEDYKISCAEGCSLCCRMFTHCFDSEAELIYDYMKVKNIKPDWVRARKQVGKGTEDFYGIKEDNRCMFLSDKGSCQIYEVRPSSCRLHYVVSDPRHCNLANGLQSVAKICFVHPEIVVSAMMRVEPGDKTLSEQMLLRRAQNVYSNNK